MATKTWKIGEYAKGGIITVETTKNSVTIIGKDWDYSTGSNRGSNQSNAKEFTRLTVRDIQYESYRVALEFLQDLTTSYYADQIMKWITERVKLNKPSNWW